MELKYLTIVACFAVCLIASAIGETEVYTPQESEALNKFRPLVTKFLDNDFMKNDAYLVSFLRERNLDPEAAKEMLLTTLKWRKDQNIGNLLNEDFSEFEKKYPFNIEGVDKEGRPIQIAPAGQWRPRQAVLGGQLDKYNRFMIRSMLEIPFQKIQQLNAVSSDKNVSRYMLIFDMHGINAREHLCLQCIQVYANLVTTAEKYYPRLAYKTFFINSPRIFETVLSVIRPLMSEFTRNNLNVLDHNRDKWQKTLLEYVDSEQLPPRYGGTKEFKQSDYYGQSYEGLDAANENQA